MKHTDSKETKKLSALLERTEAVMADFTKLEHHLKEWRQEMSAQTALYKEQMNEIKTEIDRMQTIISEAGLECFQTAAEETLSQSDTYINGLKHTEEQLLRQIHDHRAELTRMIQHAMTRITQKTAQAIALFDEKFEKKLSNFDAKQFNQIAHESCQHVEKSANAVIGQGRKLLKHFEWRSVTLTLATSLATALVLGLYTNAEYPWEMHQKAINERDAGRVLLEAWPSLTHLEKNKILHNRSS